ncbi:MAG TPA: cyclic nucleotide-binding domain-containing protein [Candidatus Limnocylindrales bacterium]|nr:cyclic nucleotide-binding domain-containing protein [Candidatus Limnocylindrales bacterium]
MASNDSKVDLIASVPLFEGLSRGELAEIAKLMDEIDVAAGTVLMKQGDLGRQMFVVARGRVAVERNGAKINELGPGGAAGEMALIAEAPRNATVTAMEPSLLLVADHRGFHSLMDVSPTIRIRIFEGLANKIRSLDPNAS